MTAPADGGLQRHSNIWRGMSSLQLLDELAPLAVGALAVRDERERVHRLAVDEHVQLHEPRRAGTREAGSRGWRSRCVRDFSVVVEVHQDLGQRDVVVEHDAGLARRHLALRFEVLHALELAAAVGHQLHDLRRCSGSA